MQDPTRDYVPVALTMTRPVAIPFYGFLGLGILALLALGATSFLGWTVYSMQNELALNTPEDASDHILDADLAAPTLGELSDPFSIRDQETDRGGSLPPRILPPLSEEMLASNDLVTLIPEPIPMLVPSMEDLASIEPIPVESMEIPMHVPAPLESMETFQTTGMTPALPAPNPEDHLGVSAEAVLAELIENEAASPETEQTLRNAIASKGGVRFTGHTASIETLAVSIDGQWLLSGGADKTARLWDMNSLNPEATCRILRGHAGRLTFAQFTPDGRWVVTAGDDGMIFAWPLNLEAVEIQPILVGTHRGALTAMKISPDGQYLASAGQGIEPSELAVKIWRLEQILSPLTEQSEPKLSPVILYGPGSAARCFAFTPDSKRLFVAGDGPAVLHYSIDPPAELARLEGHHDAVTRFEVHSSGDWAVSASRDDTLRLWDLQSDSPSETSFVMDGPTDDIECLTLSGDGEWIVAGGRDCKVRLWNCATNRLYVLEGHEATIRCLMFSPDGRWLATGDSYGKIRLWNAQNPESEYSILLEGHRGPILALAARPDGDWLLSGAGASPEGEDTDIRLWNLTTEGLLFTAQAVAERSRESLAQRPEELDTTPQDQWDASY